jgi:hypothetical protein
LTDFNLRAFGAGQHDAGASSAPPVELEPTNPEAAPARPPGGESADALGFDSAVRGLAELAAHRSAGSPLAMALMGPPGSGKSFALGRLVDISLACSRQAQGNESSFVPDIVVARVEASQGQDPATTLAAGVYAALVQSSPANATLAEDAAEAGADPEDAARAASERLIELRRRLDSERQTLGELSGRRARLSETVLYQSAGSRIDNWARTNRNRIESRLRAFGFQSGDPVTTYKDLVRDLSDNGGPAGKVAAFLRATWAFRGQTQLLVLAALLFILAWALGLAQDQQPAWASWLRGQGEWGQTGAAWLEGGGAGLFSLLTWLAFWGAVASLALNVWRAARFVAPLFRGVSLLNEDIGAGGREIDSLIANQTRLVDDLAAQADAQARRAEEAERRVATLGARRREEAAVTPFDRSDDADAGRKRARHFLDAISREVANGAGPGRVLVAVDDVDSLSPQAAAAFVDEACALLARPPFVLALAVDPQRLAAGWGPDGANRLARRVQIGVRVDAASTGDYARLVRRLLAGGEDQAASTDEDVRGSIWDRPVGPDEAALLEALAPLAGRTPRCVAQFVTAYRLGRGRTEAFAPLALALAIDIGGRPEEKAAVSAAMSAALPGHAFEVKGPTTRLAEAIGAARAAHRGPLTAGDMRAAMNLAATYSLEPSAA